MIILAFSVKTSKILPRLVCRRFRHVAPILPNRDGTLTLYQFVRRGNVARIKIRTRDINTLYRHGWRFIYLTGTPPHDFHPDAAHTCVDLSKRAIGMHAPFVLRPDALYRRVAFIQINE